MGQGRRLPRRARGTLALACLAIAALGASPGRVPAAPLASDFFGFSSFQDLSQADLARAKAGGLSSYRVSFTWQAIQPQQGGPFDFSHYDAVVGDAARAGIQVVPLLYGSPTYINPRNNRPPIETAAQRAMWSSFLTAVVARYGRGGSFWAAHPELPSKPLVDWIVWNEPNLHIFWYPKPLAGRYVKLLALTRSAIQSVDPQARIVSAGLFTEPRRGTGIPLVSYLNALYRVKGFKRNVDAVAVHPFAQKPGQVLDVVRGARRVMNRHGDSATPIWVNELAWSTGGGGSNFFKTSLAGQASRLSTSYRLLLSHRRGLRLERLLWLAYRDVAGGANQWIQFTGLFRVNGSPKPSWSALTRITGGTP